MGPALTPRAARHYDRTGRTFILLCLAAALWFGWKIFRPFLGAIAAAAILDVVFFPLFASLARRFGGRRYAAAGVTVLVVVLCVILPMLVMGVVFAREAVQAYTYLSTRAQDGTLDQVLKFRDWDAIETWLRDHAPWLDVQALNLKNAFVTLLQKVSTKAVAFVSGAATNLLSTIGTFAVVLFSLFFFLVDGEAFVRWAGGLVPLTAEHKQVLGRTFLAITRSSVLGSGLVAVVQGVLGGFAFRVVGLPGVLWGFAMTFMSFVPVVGTAVVWIPAGLVLLATGRVGAGIFLLVWGALVISSADNVTRILVVRGPVRTHPLLLFFSILGGIKLAGLLGVVFGPLILATIQTLLEIYRGEFMERPPEAAAEEQT